MEFLRSRRQTLCALFVLVLSAVIYWTSLPTTAQYLDSSEMVAGSYRLFRVHPPGFPLYMWLTFLWTHLLVVSTVFWRAAFATSMYALLSLALFLRLGRNALFSLVCVLPLALSALFWRYAVLPDVFMLLALFATAICYVYLTWAPSPKKASVLVLLLALGGLNHTMLVFLAPVVIDSYLNRGLSRRSMFAFVGACMLFAIGYCSLILLNNAHTYSWGSVRTPMDALGHLMRHEVGGWKMAAPMATGTEAATFWFSFETLILTVWKSLPLACVVSVVPLIALFQKRAGFYRSYWILLLSLVLYISVLSALNNVVDIPSLEKFYLFPTILVLALSSIGWAPFIDSIAKQSRRPSVIAAILVAVALLLSLENYFENRIVNDYSWNTVVEDYGLNLLRMSQSERSTILLVEGDTTCFSTRYAQLVLNEAPNTFVFCRGTLFNAVAADRFKRLLPKLQLNIGDHSTADYDKDFLLPNMSQYDEIVSFPAAPGHYHVTFLGVGRRLSEGSGASVDSVTADRIKLRSTAAILPPSKEKGVLKGLYSNYAYLYLEKGLEHQDDPAAATKDYEQALSIVPYCLPAIAKLCEIKVKAKQDANECRAQGDEVYATEANYYR